MIWEILVYQNRLIITIPPFGSSFRLPLTSLIMRGEVEMNQLRIGNLTVAVPIIPGGMGVGISLSGLAAVALLLPAAAHSGQPEYHQ